MITVIFDFQISIEKLDDSTNEVEDTFMNLLANKRAENTGNHSNADENSIIIERNVQKDFQEAVNERIMDDIPKVLGSFLVMFVYVSLSLGKLNCFENRVSYCFFMENSNFIQNIIIMRY